MPLKVKQTLVWQASGAVDRELLQIVIKSLGEKRENISKTIFQLIRKLEYKLHNVDYLLDTLWCWIHNESPMHITKVLSTYAQIIHFVYYRWCCIFFGPYWASVLVPLQLIWTLKHTDSMTRGIWIMMRRWEEVLRADQVCQFCHHLIIHWTKWECLDAWHWSIFFFQYNESEGG